MGSLDMGPQMTSLPLCQKAKTCHLVSIMKQLRQLASCRGWKETTPIKRKHAEFPYRPAESPVWRHRNDPGRVRKTRFGFEPEGHQERKGPSSQPQVECFTCQACRTALQNLGLPMRLQARFLAVLSTPQEIGCLWSFQQVAATCIAHSLEACTGLARRSARSEQL